MVLGVIGKSAAAGNRAHSASAGPASAGDAADAVATCADASSRNAGDVCETQRQVPLEHLEGLARAISSVQPAHFDLSDPVCAQLNAVIFLDVLAVRLAWLYWQDELRAVGSSDSSALHAVTQSRGSSGKAVMPAPSSRRPAPPTESPREAGFLTRSSSQDPSGPPRCSQVIPARYSPPASKAQQLVGTPGGSFGYGSRGLLPAPRGKASSRASSPTTASASTGRGAGCSSQSGVASSKAERITYVSIPFSRARLSEPRGSSPRASHTIAEKRVALAQMLGQECPLDVGLGQPRMRGAPCGREGPASVRGGSRKRSAVSARLAPASTEASPATTEITLRTPPRSSRAQQPLRPTPPGSLPSPPVEVKLSLVDLSVEGDSAAARTSVGPQDPPCARGSKSLEDVLFEVDLDLGNGAVAPIQVKHGDDLRVLASDFVRRHSLPESSIRRIASYLQRLRAEVGAGADVFI